MSKEEDRMAINMSHTDLSMLVAIRAGVEGRGSITFGQHTFSQETFAFLPLSTGPDQRKVAHSESISGNRTAQEHQT